jgi:hypothetical protein
MQDQKTSLITCKYCKHPGLVWYKTRAGKYVLADPNPDLTPNPKMIHCCVFKKRQNNSSTKSGKASTWRLGKSPSSYG